MSMVDLATVVVYRYIRVHNIANGGFFNIGLGAGS